MPKNTKIILQSIFILNWGVVCIPGQNDDAPLLRCCTVLQAEM